MLLTRLALILLWSGALASAQRARNVILFLADGAGIPTLNAASIHGYGKPLALYVQNMPYIGLSDTSSSIAWITDSAAGMTAIVTGQKTKNGVISQSDAAEPLKRDGQPLKTILEHAEERGLATGVVSNSSMVDATPAACYAHANHRRLHAEIFRHVLEPKYGDGVDLILGPGRKGILQVMAERGKDLASELPRRGYAFLDSPAALDRLDPKARRVVALWDTDEFDLNAVVDRAVTILSRNPKGFFLMVESNAHFEDTRRTLDRAVAFDRVIRGAAERTRRDTLLLFTADHSYGLRLANGRIGQDILPLVRIDPSHTAEEVLVAAEGPGAQRVHGMFPNTRLFHIMMAAYGWE